MEDSLKTVYGKLQDSIVQLKGLKLLKFEKDGSFLQMDSITRPGRWKILAGRDTLLVVTSGGKGFSPFEVSLIENDDSVVILSEMVKYEGRVLRLDWNLKRIVNDDTMALFGKESNRWRLRSLKPESEKELKIRLAAMLKYYSDYYNLVAREASYFISSRVEIPFKYYQHAIELRPLTVESSFHRFFFDSTQAIQAFDYIKKGMRQIGTNLTRGENFVTEYADYLKMLSEVIEK